MAQEDWESANTAFTTGTLLSCDSATLQNHLLAISNQQIRNDTIQHRDIVRGITINHILLQRHIDVLQQHITALNKQNAKTQKLVVALTLASLIGTGAQVWYAVKSDKKSEREALPTASAPQTPTQQSSAPTPSTPQASGQPTKK